MYPAGFVNEAGRVQSLSSDVIIVDMQFGEDENLRGRLSDLVAGIGHSHLPGNSLDLLLGATGTSVVVTDPHQEDNPIVYVSKGFEHLTGYESYEVLGKNCRFMQGDQRDQAGVAELREAIQQRRSVRVTLLNYRKDGSEFCNELTVSPVFNKEGEVVLFTGVQKDVTELRALEQDLAETKARERHLRELSQLEGLVGGSSPTTARSLGVGSLSEGSSQLFAKLVENYGEVFEWALEQRAYQVEREVTSKLRELATALAAVRASARDIIDLHTTSLKMKRQAANAERAQVYTEEGRLLVLELMGLVLNEYRPYAFGAASRRAAREEARD